MMKTLCRRILLAVWLLALVPGTTVRADDESDRDRKAQEIDAAFQMVFYAVLEGSFEDGLSNADVDQILRREDPAQGPVHLIANCPICMATKSALETYRARANAHVPSDERGKRASQLTFGKGLSPAVHARLYSGDLKERLAAIHDLEESWVERRINALRLDAGELARARNQLKAGRDEGMRMLQIFLQQGTANQYTPGYHEGDECALCNAAAGMKLKLAAQSPQP